VTFEHEVHGVIILPKHRMSSFTLHSAINRCLGALTTVHVDEELHEYRDGSSW